MSSRLNLKFMIPLVVAVLVLGVAGYVTVTKFVFKSAAENAAIADRAMEDGRAAYAAGDIEEANAFFVRAAQRYGGAYDKDSQNTTYLYKSIEANESYICEQLTEAQNRLMMVYNASMLAHNVPGASVDDQQQFYDRMMTYHRMGLTLNGQLPWIHYLNNTVVDEFDANPNNDLARRWRGITSTYLLRNDMPDEERVISLNDLQHALDQAEGDDPLVLYHMAIWHYNEGQRFRDAAGGQMTDTATQQFSVGLAYSERAYAAAPNDPLIAYRHLNILMSSPLDEAVRDAIGQVMLGLAQQLADDADARATLYPAELSRLIAWLGTYPRLVGDTETPALPLALAIGEKAVADEPGLADPYKLYAQAQLAGNAYEDAIATLDTGLALQPHLGPAAFLIELQSKIAMIAQLADSYINLASQQGTDTDARDALLDQAHQALARYRAAEGADSRFHEARASYLAGRAAFVQDTPQLAVGHLEEANLFYKNADLQTVALLAKAHDRNQNLGAAAELYETVLQLEPRARNERLRLAQLYIELGGGYYLPRAQTHLTRFLEFNPSDLQARLLMAQLLATNAQYTEAAAIVEAIGLEENPQLVGTYAQYLSQAGQSEQALAIVKERLAVEPNDTNALSVLFTLVTDETQRLAELTALEANGLEPERAAQYRRLIENGGRMTIGEYIELAEASGTDELLIKKQLYVTYAQSNQDEKMRETLAEMTAMAPRDANVLEWRFILSVLDKDFALADRMITQMLELPTTDRPKIAIGNGVFLRAQVLAGRARAQTGAGEAPDLRESVRAYRRALEDHPSYAPGWVELGRLQMFQQDWPRATESLNRAYQIQPTNTEAAMLLARALRLSGETDLALDIYRNTIRRQPNNQGLMEEYLALEATGGVRRLAIERRQTLRDERPDNVQNRRALAVMLAEDGRHEDALAEIAALESDAGVSLGTTNAAAQIHVMAEEVQAGVDTFTRYIEDRGEDANVLDYLAFAEFLSRLDRDDASASAYQQAIAHEAPETRRASRAWASALARSGEFAQASSLLRELAAAFPDEHAFKMDLALIHLAEGRYDLVESTLAQVPGSVQTEKLRAQSQMQQGNADTALAIVREAQKDNANSTDLASLEARLLAQLGEEDIRAGRAERGRARLTQAKEIYERLVRANSGLFELRVLIARLDFALGNRNAGIEQLVRLLDDNADVASARTSLFSFYITMSNELRANHPQKAQLAQLALSTLRPLLEKQPENEGLLRQAAFAANEAGAFDAAVAYAQSVYDLTGSLQDLAGLVAPLLSNSQPREALTLLNQPKHASDLAEQIVLRAMQARALANSGRSDEARNLFKSLLGRAAGPAELNAVFGQLRQSTLQGQQVAIVEEALGSDRPAAIELQLALIEQSQEDWPAVIQRLSPWETSAPENEQINRQAMLSLALAYQQVAGQDNLLRAKSIYEDLLESTPESQNLELLNNLAYLLTDGLIGGNYADQAVTYAQRAVDLIHDKMTDLDRALILDTLGWAQFQAGDLDDAIATLRQSIAAYPLSVNQKHLGQLYMSQGRNDQALLQFDNARRASKDPAERAEIQGLIDQL